MQYILRDKHGEGNPPQIPDHIRMEIARCLLPDIIAFYESEKGQREFEEWKKKNIDSGSGSRTFIYNSGQHE